MDNEIQVFAHDQFGDVRVVEKDGEPWFVGKDVAKALGYTDTYGALKKHVDEEDKQNCQNGSFESPRGMTIVNESGLYSLILGSKLESAKQFKRWVTAEVLPSVRKHGMYVEAQKLQQMMSQPETIIQVFTALKEEQDKRKAAEVKTQALTGETLEWDKKAVINAAMRRLSTAMPAYRVNLRFAQAWNAFKQEMLYKHHVGIQNRLAHLSYSKGNSYVGTLDVLNEDELNKAIGVVTALCEERSIDISDLLLNAKEA